MDCPFILNIREKKYLLDTGSTGLFLENARKLGIEIAEVDTAFCHMSIMIIPADSECFLR